MRKVLIILGLLIAGLLPGLAQAQDAGWLINSFDSKITISQSGQVQVDETITVDFDALQKHGIYRDIPVIYSTKSGNKLNIDLKVSRVLQDNQPAIYELSRQGKNQRIKIGDPNRTITGRHSYEIDYTVAQVINFFSDHSELYWNVNGFGWPVPIEQSQATVSFPAGIIQVECFTGELGSQAKDCSTDIAADKQSAQFATSQPLAPGENLTIVAGFPADAITKPSSGSIIWRFLRDNLAYFVPFIVLGFLLYRWWRFGRDPKGRVTVAPEFAPPQKLAPAEMGVIIDEKADIIDISSTIVHLATRGYLEIFEEKKKGFFGGSTDYRLVKKKPATGLVEFEKQVFDGLFESGEEVRLSDLKTKYYQHLNPIRRSLYQLVAEKKFFSTDPDKVRRKYYGGGILLLAIGIFTIFGGVAISAIAWPIAIAISGLLVMIFAPLMPKKTLEGRETLRQIEGFKLYMSTAEKYRQKFYEEKNIFEKYLPYAMVFGIVKKWAKAFEGLKVEPPSWYHSNTAFNAWIFASAMDNFGTSVGSVLPSAPASKGGSGFGGGGFSGGGFGGGGGGSW